MGFKVTKQTALTVLSGAFTVGTIVIGAIMKKDDNDEIAKKAAKIVMEQQSKKSN